MGLISIIHHNLRIQFMGKFAANPEFVGKIHGFPWFPYRFSYIFPIWSPTQHRCPSLASWRSDQHRRCLGPDARALPRVTQWNAARKMNIWEPKITADFLWFFHSKIKKAKTPRKQRDVANQMWFHHQNEGLYNTKDWIKKTSQWGLSP